MRRPSRPVVMALTAEATAALRPGCRPGAVARVAQVALAAIVAAGAAGCVVRVDTDGVRVREEKRFTTKGRPTVQLATFDGSIVIRGWDRDEISVEIEKRGRDKAAAEAIEVIAEQKGDAVNVEARKKDLSDGKSYQLGWNGVSRSAKLVVSVPAGSDLIVRTGDGSIRVDHVNGKVELQSADGSVTGRDLAGDVVAHTEDGSHPARRRRRQVRRRLGRRQHRRPGPPRRAAGQHRGRERGGPGHRRIEDGARLERLHG